jgi:hypothetical protein
MQSSIISGRKRNYFENDAKAVAGWNLEDGRPVYKVSKEHNIPPPTFFKGMLLISPPAEKILIVKKEMPFNVTSEGNSITVSYMTKMQSIGLGPSTTSVRATCTSPCKQKYEGKKPSIMYPLCGFSLWRKIRIQSSRGPKQLSSKICHLWQKMTLKYMYSGISQLIAELP